MCCSNGGLSHSRRIGSMFWCFRRICCLHLLCYWIWCRWMSNLLGRKKVSIICTWRLQRSRTLSDQKCRNLPTPSTHLLLLVTGNHLNRIQSAWRWRNNFAPKCHNKLTEHSVITRRPSFGFNTLFWKYNMVGFYCKSLGNTNLG
jgi:hypothetical protein